MLILVYSRFFRLEASRDHTRDHDLFRRRQRRRKSRFAKIGRQIEEAFEAASQLAGGSNLSPADFYQQFLNRTLTADRGPGRSRVAARLQGFLQIACQINLEKVGLENKRRSGRQCHNEVLRQVFTAAPPRPMMLEPNGRMAPNQGVEQGAVPAANLTDYFALFAPIVTPGEERDGRPRGVPGSEP